MAMFVKSRTQRMGEAVSGWVDARRDNSDFMKILGLTFDIRQKRREIWQIEKPRLCGSDEEARAEYQQRLDKTLPLEQECRELEQQRWDMLVKIPFMARFVAAKEAGAKVRNLRGKIQELGDVCVKDELLTDLYGIVHIEKRRCSKYKKCVISPELACPRKKAKTQKLILQRRLRNLKRIRTKSFFNVLFVTRKTMQLWDCFRLAMAANVVSDKHKESYNAWASVPPIEGFSSNNPQFESATNVMGADWRGYDRIVRKLQTAKAKLFSWTK